MRNDNTKKIWDETWEQETHTTDYALKRIKSAKSAKLTPIKIDATDNYGYFQGRSGKYETFLDFCPCGDFRRSRLPCKHIYRLAAELGLMDIKCDYDPNAILTPKEKLVSLDDTIDIVENLSTNAQYRLLEIASNIRSTKPIFQIVSDESVVELLNSGIIIDTEPQNHKIKFGKKSDIIKLLNEKNISYNKKAKKNELEAICLEHLYQESERAFECIMCVTIPTKFSAKNIHFYLHRKYDHEFFFNGEEYPRLLDTDLPDDHITNQLIKRGYYTRK